MEQGEQDGPILHPNEDNSDNLQLELETQINEQELPTDSYYDSNVTLLATNTALVRHFIVQSTSFNRNPVNQNFRK